MKLGQQYRVVRKEWAHYIDQIGMTRDGWRILDYDTIYVDEIELSGKPDGYGGETTYVYARSRVTNRRFRGLIDPLSMGPQVPVWAMRDMMFFPYSEYQKNLFVGSKENPKPFIWRDR